MPDYFRHIAGEKTRMIDLLSELVHIESPTNNFAAQQLVLKRIAAFLHDLKFHTHLVEGRGNSGGHLLAYPADRVSGRALQLLVGHCDTVWPVGTIESMPFRVDGNRIRGPGVFDMKGGIVQMLFALNALRSLNTRWHVTPVIFINSDEEKGSRDSRRHIVRLAEIACRALVLEPALGIDGQIKTRRKGVGRFEIRIIGQSAHAGLDPEQGASAIVALSRIVQRLNELNDTTRGISVNVGRIDGGISPNVVAPDARASIDVRVPSASAAEATEARIRSIRPSVPGTKIEISGGFGRPPLEKNRRNRLLWDQVQTVASDMGLELSEGLAGGASDGNTTSRYTATLDGLGAVGDGAHAAHEFMFEDRMIERTALLAGILSMPVQNVASTTGKFSEVKSVER